MQNVRKVGVEGGALGRRRAMALTCRRPRRCRCRGRSARGVKPSVDLALILATDVSLSIDEERNQPAAAGLRLRLARQAGGRRDPQRPGRGASPSPTSNGRAPITRGVRHPLAPAVGRRRSAATNSPTCSRKCRLTQGTTTSISGAIDFLGEAVPHHRVRPDTQGDRRFGRRLQRRRPADHDVARRSRQGGHHHQRPSGHEPGPGQECRPTRPRHLLPRQCHRRARIVLHVVFYAQHLEGIQPIRLKEGCCSKSPATRPKGRALRRLKTP